MDTPARRAPSDLPRRETPAKLRSKGSFPMARVSTTATPREHPRPIRLPLRSGSVRIGCSYKGGAARATLTAAAVRTSPDARSVRTCGSVGEPPTGQLSGTASEGRRVSATSLPAAAAIRPSGPVSGLASWIRTPTVLDGACSVFDLFGADDVLAMVDATSLEPYEVVAAHAWQRVGDSMRVVLDTRLSAS